MRIGGRLFESLKQRLGIRVVVADVSSIKRRDNPRVNTVMSRALERERGERQARSLSPASCHVRLVCSPDGFARDDQFHAAILLFAGGRAVRGDRLALAET